MLVPVLLEIARLGGVQILVISVGRQHVHLLTELSSSRSGTKQIVGLLKTVSAAHVRHPNQPRLWGTGGNPKAVDDQLYQRRVFSYIRNEQEPDAITWDYRMLVPTCPVEIRLTERQCELIERWTKPLTNREPDPKAAT